jgi:glycosyltransferase involved in cell wall biosynthesis
LSERRPRVLVLQSWISYRGAEQISAEIARRTAGRLLTAYVDINRLPPQADAVDYILPPRPLRWLMSQSLVAYLVLAPIVLTVMAVIHARRADVVNPHNAPTEIAAGVARSLHHRPTVWMCHGLPPELSMQESRSLLEWLIWKLARSPIGRWGRRQNDAIIAVSKRLAARVADDTGRSAHVIYPAIQLDFYKDADRANGRQKLGLGSDQPCLVTVGTITRRKDQRRVIEAMPELLKQWPSMVLVIVGTGPAEGECRQLVNELGLTGSVRFERHVPGDRIADHYAAADLHVVPYWRDEGCTLTPLEAMACGTLSLVARDCGADELIEEWNAGWVWDHEVPIAGAIAHGLAEVLSGTQRQAIERGLAGVRQLSWDHQLAQIEEVFRTAGTRRPASVT